MKFFTRPFISGTLPNLDRDRAIAGYRTHLASLKLPPAVDELAALYVHDAQVKAIDFDGDTLTLHLRCGDLQRGYVDARLTFAGAYLTDHAVSLLKDAETEILASEVDRKDAAFDYRLLLWPRGQVAIRFRDVHIRRKRVAVRVARRGK